jgi:tetratricopeptide (TPR) repeat protein
MKKAKLDEKKEQGQATQRTQEGFVVRVFNFFNQYDKIIYGVAIGLLAVVALLLAFNKFYLVPQTEKASALMTAPIENMMRADSLSLVMALEGDDEYEGFLTIASSFRLTKTANTAKYFAGLCYLKLGEQDEALRYLLRFRHKEDVYWYGAQALISDIYDDQGDTRRAIRFCRRATEGDDPYLTPVNLFKLGQLYEREGDWRRAVSAYQTIQNNFYTEYQKMGVDRYLERALINQK